MPNSLIEFSNALAALVEGVSPSVVRVEARRRMPASGIIWSAAGHIVTANHVVEHDENIQVGLPAGETLPASLVGRDPATDLAVLRVERQGLTAAHWLEASELRVGQWVMAVARPGRSLQTTSGVVSALGGAWRTGAGGQIDTYIQTDTAMYPGFSGGPLVAPDGRVAGLNTSAIVGGVGLALPAATVRRVVEAILEHGRIPRGYLGVGVQPVRLAPSIQAEAGAETGLMVLSVEPDGPAEKAGVLQGDILVAVDGRQVREVDDLHALLTSELTGAPATLRLVRSNQFLDLPVTIGQR